MNEFDVHSHFSKLILMKASFDKLALETSLYRIDPWNSTDLARKIYSKYHDAYSRFVNYMLYVFECGYDKRVEACKACLESLGICYECDLRFENVILEMIRTIEDCLNYFEQH